MAATPDIAARGRYLSNPVTVSLTGTTARSAQLKKQSKYEIFATVDWFFLQGTVAVDATTSSHPRLAYQPTTIVVEDATSDGYIAGILSAGTGTLYIAELS